MARNDSDKKSSEKKIGAQLKLLLPADAVEDRDSINFSERLRQVRAVRGLTLKELSLITKAVDSTGQGVSTVSISRYESGAEPGLRELRLLSLALRMSISYFVYGDSEDPMSPSSRGMNNLELVFEDKVIEIVQHILERRGIVPQETIQDIRDLAQYDALIETIRKKG